MNDLPHGNTCSLCGIELEKFSTIDEDLGFCCSGCHAVYRILASKHLLDNYQETTVFKEALKAGLISNPSLLHQLKKERSQITQGELQKIHLEIFDMWCPSCAEVIRLILLQQEGILNCVVDYATDLASIEFAPQLLSKEKIFQLITTIGYQPKSLEDSHKKKVSLDLYLRFGVAAFFALNAMMFSYPLYATYFDPQAYEDGKIFAWLTCLSSLPVVTYCMWPILKRFLTSVQLGLLGMEALVVIGVSAAFGLSLFQLWRGNLEVYFDSMCVIVALVLLGKIIETKAKFSAKESLFRLTKSLPRKGRKRFSNGSTDYVNIKEIQLGDTLVAYPGEKIILDGIVIEGNGSCDESLITGESLPVRKGPGDALVSGSLVLHRALVFRVLNCMDTSTLQKIIQTVEQDIGHKSVYHRAADQIVHYFVPLVIVLAVLSGFVGWGLDVESFILRAISILLIACPCAIGIAAPLAESQLLHQLASMGIIVRNRGCLSSLSKISTFVFDKTGTVTLGQFALLEGLEDFTREEKKLLKGISKPSNHLISQAIFNSLDTEEMLIDNIEECPGKGMKGTFKDQKILLGSSEFLIEHGISIPFSESSSQDVTTIVYFFSGSNIHRLKLGDAIRSEVKEIIPQLSVPTILLSGDGRVCVEFVAAACGFHSFHFKASPLQKRDFVEHLRSQQHTVCMIGDGINDAPALTAAHVGISVVSATDISIQVSDILLTTSDLRVLPKMLEMIGFGHRILKQNLFWAFFYNILGIGLAILGLLTPLFAAFAMTISSLIVLINSKRITS